MVVNFSIIRLRYQDPAIYVISAIYDVSLLLVDATIYNKRPLPLFNVAKYENSRH
jgi:hypothetical protein